MLVATGALLLLAWDQPKATSQPISNQLKSQQTKTISQVKVGDALVDVEIADSKYEIEKGLSNRESLADNNGMYFILPKRQVVGFWMKDMHFSIDLIWVDNGVIVGFVENAPLPPDTGDLPTYISPSEVTRVLEVNAGFVKKHSLSIGQKIVEIH